MALYCAVFCAMDCTGLDRMGKTDVADAQYNFTMKILDYSWIYNADVVVDVDASLVCFLRLIVAYCIYDLFYRSEEKFISKLKKCDNGYVTSFSKVEFILKLSKACTAARLRVQNLRSVQNVSCSSDVNITWKYTLLLIY